MNSQNDKITYLTASDLYNINAEVTGYVPFVRDHHLLQSAARRPAIRLFGQPQFPTLYDKAAALMHSLAYHHLFADGNKRTAARAIEIFMEMNGFAVMWNPNEAYVFILEIAKGELDIETIADWLRENCEA